ncbi:hypothetical protein HRbin16_00245 [bacterium HR16]|nr:hypothetical protein HRbin16_00245 [bacterium HR16]
MNAIQHGNVVHLLLADGRPSGCVLDGWRLVRRVRGSVHMLKRPPAWSFELGILEAAHEARVSVVEVCDVETGVTYTAPLPSLWRHGIRIQRDGTQQLALELRFWHVHNPRQPTLFDA